MDFEKLKKFLVKAKINTYATDGEDNEETLLDGTKELEFKEGDFLYRDRYFGSNPFIGEEVVFYNGKVIWGMNYCGGVILDVSSEEIYVFLKKALRLVDKAIPFRGPKHFEDGKLKYINTVNGDIKKFDGIEKISSNEKGIYKLIYHGGIVN